MAGAERKSLEPFLKDDVEFYDYQVEGIRRLARMRSFLLADEMGLGKSLQALTVFCIDVKLKKAETLLVVCPATLRNNWAREISKFTRIPYTLLGEEPHPVRRGEMRVLPPAKRDAQLSAFFYQPGPRILIANYEQVSSDYHVHNFATHHFDTVIFDEAHRIKNHRAKRTKACLDIKSYRSFVLTGTPLLNRVDELWPVLNRIDPKQFPKYWSFVNRYCVFGGYESKQIIGVKNEHELNKVLASVMVRRLKKNVLDLKDPRFIKVYVGLTKKQRELYDLAADELLVDDDPDIHDKLQIKNHLTKFLRLKQICGSPASLSDDFPDSSEKLDRVIELIQELMFNNEKVIVFTQFRGIMRLLVQRLIAAGIKPIFQLHGDVQKADRQGVVDLWSDHKGPSVMLLMTQMAEGLNMTAARTGIFVDKLFTPGKNDQAVDRMHRIGQKNEVMIYELLAVDTIEERIEEILAMKVNLFDKTIETAVSLGKLVEMLREKMRSDMSKV